MADLSRIRGLAFDVDGVLTDGTVYIGAGGEELKRFSIPDGTALMWCRMLGFELALISGRSSGATARRAEELGIEAVYQGVRDKAGQVAAWAAGVGLGLDEVLYMGDDQIDLPVFKTVAVSVAPANADSDVRGRATHATRRRGGEGAVREAVRWLLESTGRLDDAMALYREGLSVQAPGGGDGSARG
ncbi:MAG TPA: HAD hydrolase family protein [Gemmatimonadota bacterium]|nr:HAD hydrolase family protein [Gemmatimonadota bacterium]